MTNFVLKYVSIMKASNKTEELIKDFRWVVKVLQSSTTKEHLITSDRLFYVVFLNKWKMIDDVLKEKFTDTYKQHKFVVKHKKIMKYGR
jgi:hypothetical protein